MTIRILYVLLVIGRMPEDILTAAFIGARHKENKLPVKIERTYKLSTNGGQTLYLSESEAQTLAVKETRMTLTCDSSKCAGRHNADAPQTIAWSEEEALKDVEKVPPTINEYVSFGQGKVACCPQCVRDYFQYDFVCPPSPRELRARMDQEKAQQAEELKEMNPHLRAPEPIQNRTTPDVKQEIQKALDAAEWEGMTADDIIRNRTEYHVTEVPATLPPHSGETLKVVATPTVEVPALCQEDEEGYGHGV